MTQERITREQKMMLSLEFRRVAKAAAKRGEHGARKSRVSKESTEHKARRELAADVEKMQAKLDYMVDAGMVTKRVATRRMRSFKAKTAKKRAADVKKATRSVAAHKAAQTRKANKAKGRTAKRPAPKATKAKAAPQKTAKPVPAAVERKEKIQQKLKEGKHLRGSRWTRALWLREDWEARAKAIPGASDHVQEILVVDAEIPIAFVRVPVVEESASAKKLPRQPVWNIDGAGRKFIVPQSTAEMARMIAGEISAFDAPDHGTVMELRKKAVARWSSKKARIVRPR